MIAWRADSVQAVAFVVPGAPQPDALAIWSILRPGEGPEAFQKHSGAPNGVSTAAGPYGSEQLSITSQIGRIDVVLHGRAIPGSNEPPALDNLDDAVRSAARQLKQLLGVAPIFRTAIVASMSVSAEAGFSHILSDISPAVVFPDNAIDCIYQLNIRRTSGVRNELGINRLCTWSSGEQNLIVFNVGGPGLQASGASPMTMKSVPIVNFNVDVNTASGPGFLISPDDAPLIDELATEVVGIAKHGAEALK